MRITLDEIRALQPCWTYDELTTKWGNRASVTPSEIVEDLEVSVVDRRWLLTQLAARTREGRDILIRWAVDCAKSVRHLVEERYLPVVDAAYSAALACIGNDNTAHKTAAYNAATAAATAAARAAATAAYNAATAAATAAARAAATAAYNAAHAAQLKNLADALENL